jgi:hypothetical protein
VATELTKLMEHRAKQAFCLFLFYLVAIPPSVPLPHPQPQPQPPTTHQSTPLPHKNKSKQKLKTVRHLQIGITVKPVNSGHPCDSQKVSLIQRCPLFRVWSALRTVIWDQMTCPYFTSVLILQGCYSQVSLYVQSMCSLSKESCIYNQYLNSFTVILPVFTYSYQKIPGLCQTRQKHPFC